MKKVKLSELKKGDKIRILWGGEIRTAKVLDNFPTKEHRILLE